MNPTARLLPLLSPPKIRTGILRPPASVEPLEARIAPATFNWINASNGLWTNPANWNVSNGSDADGVPDADDDVTINPAGAITVTINSAQAVHSIAAPGDDHLALTAGSLTLGAASSIAHLDVSGGKLTANALLTLTGTGTFSGSGTLSGTIRNEGVLQLPSDAPSLNAVTLENAGTIVNSGAVLKFEAGSHLTNLAGGVFDISSGGNGASLAAAGTALGFDNFGIFRHSGTGSATIGGVPFNNLGGTIEVTGGSLALNAGGSYAGTAILVAAGKTLSLDGGTKTITGTLTGTGAGQVTFGSGTLAAGTGEVTLNFPAGMFLWSGTGTLKGGTFRNTAFLQLASDGPALNNVLLENAGTIVNSGAVLGFESGSHLVNLAGALFDSTSGANGGIIGSGGTVLGFDNFGTFRHSGAGSANLGGGPFGPVPFNNFGGTIEVTGGVLTLNSSGSYDDTTILVSAGKTLSLNGGSGAVKTISGSLAGTGLGNVTFNVSTLAADTGGATLDFPAGMFLWFGSGTLKGGTFTNTGFLQLTSDAPALNNATLQNAGTIVNSGAALSFETGSHWINLAGSLFDNTSAATGAILGNAGTSLGFDNYGIFRHSGAGNANLGGGPFGPVPFNNHGGTIEVTGGSLTLNGSGSYDNTTLVVAAGKTLSLNGVTGGIKTISGSFAGSGLGTVNFNLSTLAAGPGGATLNFPVGMFLWFGSATFKGGTFTNAGYLQILSDAPALNNVTLENAGTIINSGATLSFEPGSHLINQAGSLFDSTSGANGNILGSGGTALGFDNFGTFRHSGTGSANIAGVPFNNAGTVEVTAGVLNLNASIANVSGQSLIGGTWKIGAAATLVLPQVINHLSSANVELAGASPQLEGIFALSPGSTLSLQGGKDYFVSSFVNAGTLVLGPGTVFNTGNFTQTTGVPLLDKGVIEFQIGGDPASGNFGMLSSNGLVQFGGTARFSLVNGFGPATGQSFTLMSFAGRTGTFPNYEGLTAQRTRIFEPTIGSSTLVLNAVATAADLAPISVAATTAGGLSGDNVTINYTVLNRQPNPTFTDSWVDSVYLSLDDQYDPTDKLIGRTTHTGAVAGGGSYNGSITAPIPGEIPGGYHIIVVVDSQGRAPDSNRTNNTLAGSTLFTTDMTPLTDGGTLNGSVAAGQDKWFRVALPFGETPHFVFSDAYAGAADFYIRQGDVPTSAIYDNLFSSPSKSSFDTVLPPNHPGETYILVHGRETAGAGANFSVKAEGLGFAITSLDHNAGVLGAGTVTATIHGSLFTPGTAFSLVSPTGSPIAAQKVYFVNSTTAWVTFDLTNATAGEYDVRADDGAAQTTLADGFHVGTGEGGNFTFSISSPVFIRPPFRGTFLTLTYDNTGGTDVLAPLLLILGDNAKIKLADESSFGGSAIEVLAANPNGPAGILPPGAHGEITFAFEPLTATAHGETTFQALVASGSGFTLDWDALKASLQPANVPNDAWNAVFTNFKAQVGTTAESLRTALADDATRLSVMGYHTTSVEQLIGYEFEEADNFGAITSRYEIGELGRGQAGPLSIHAVTDPAGDVTIINGDEHRIFFKSGGAFIGASNDPAKLTRDGNGVFHLLEAGGAETVFRANDGRLDHFSDGHGHTVTAGYDAGGVLTSAVTNTGDTTTFAHNAQGRISSITDPVGRVTTFTYDATGEHLASVSDVGGTTSFTYVTGQGAPREHALASITFPDGTHELFQYDPQGRVTTESRDAGALATTFTYDSTGGFTSTDLGSHSSTFWHVPGGAIGRSFDALGHVQAVIPAGFGGDRGTIFADGTSLVKNNDALTGVLTVTNGLGKTTTYDYGSTPLRLELLINANGGATHFTYDPTGDVTSIVASDGSKIQFSYDAHGNRTAVVNELGQAVALVYDAHDLLTRKNLPDGTHVDYTYDAHRNLLNASIRAADNSDLGTTSFEYDTHDRVTKVTYPDGKFLSYTYDSANRRATASDGSFTEHYHYDALGRLDRISDTSDATIATYAYDDVGRLATETRGNGTTTTYAYDALNRTTSIVHQAPDASITESFTYTYDAGSRVKTVTTLAGTTTYSYDLAGELTNVALPGGRTIAYAYDANGNREVVSDSASGGANYTSNGVDEYTAVNGTTYLYDASGHLVRKTDASGATIYQYDAEGRLTKTISPTDTFIYSYDALGNRIATTKNGARTSYVIDPDGLGNVFAEYDNGGALVAHYAQGFGLESRIDANGVAAYYHYDQTGNTELRTGAGGVVLNTYDYLPFGEKVSSTGTAPNAYTFNGQFGVQDRGDGLYDMRARSYDASLGRFTQRDPLSVLAGDTNLYRFGSNDPVNRVDPTGLLAFITGPVGIALGSISAAVLNPFGATAGQLFAPLAPLAPLSFTGATEIGAGVVTREVALKAFTGTVVDLAATDVAAVTTTQVALKGGASLLTTTSSLSVALPTALGGALILGATDLGLRIFAPDVHDHVTQTVGNALFNHPQDVINHETENRIQNAARAPQVQKYLNDIATDPNHPTIEQIALAQRFSLEEADLTRYYDLVQLHKLFPGAYPDPGPPPNPRTHSQTLLPGDPNNIVGPGGFGADEVATVPHSQPTRFDGFVKDDGSFSFSILFENRPDASAPAQHVVITETLDVGLDLKTFSLGSFGFGDFRVDAPSGQSHFATRIDARATLGLFVDVDASLDTATRILTVSYTSIDPQTGDLPLDALAGFLPANLLAPEGDGFLTYSVKPKAGLASGTQFHSKATIVFDTEAAIDTPLITNTLDTVAPTSAVTPFASSTSTRGTFKVAFTGADNAGGSGLSAFNVFVSDNDGPLQFFATGVVGNVLRYTGGEAGHTYKFFNSAVDNVGNIEAIAATPDAQITIVAPTFVDVGHSKTLIDADGDQYTIHYSGPGTAKVALLDPDGDGRGAIDFLQIDGSTAKSKISVTVKKKPGGDGTVQIGDVTIHGDLNSFAATKSDLVFNGFVATGAVKSISVRDVLQPDALLAHPALQIGGLATAKTKVSARTLADGFALTVPGVLSSLTATAIGDGAITAASVGPILVKAGAFAADLISAGKVGNITVKGGGLSGALSAMSFGAVSVRGGDLSGTLTSLTPAATLGHTAALKSVVVTGGDLTGDIRLLGNAGAITVKNVKTGGGNVTGATVTAAKIAALTVAKDFSTSFVLAGADLGTDHAPGGTNAAADVFAAGSIGKVQIGGAVTASVIAAGLASTDGFFHDANDTIIGGQVSMIASLVIRGQADSTSYFATGRFKGLVKINNQKIAPSADARFLVLG